MGIELLTERLKDRIGGVLGCWDRVLIFGYYFYVIDEELGLWALSENPTDRPF
jgi:hypothetical protein